MYGRHPRRGRQRRLLVCSARSVASPRCRAAVTQAMRMAAFNFMSRFRWLQRLMLCTRCRCDSCITLDYCARNAPELCGQGVGATPPKEQNEIVVVFEIVLQCVQNELDCASLRVLAFTSKTCNGAFIFQSIGDGRRNEKKKHPHIAFHSSDNFQLRECITIQHTGTSHISTLEAAAPSARMSYFVGKLYNVAIAWPCAVIRSAIIAVKSACGIPCSNDIQNTRVCGAT